VDPNFYSKNLMYLGKTYQRMGERELAVYYLAKAYEYPLNSPDDREVGCC
jgi:hypothetical protein